MTKTLKKKILSEGSHSLHSEFGGYDHSVDPLDHLKKEPKKFLLFPLFFLRGNRGKKAELFELRKIHEWAKSLELIFKGWPEEKKVQLGRVLTCKGVPKEVTEKFRYRCALTLGKTLELNVYNASTFACDDLLRSELEIELKPLYRKKPLWEANLPELYKRLNQRIVRSFKVNFITKPLGLIRASGSVLS